MAKRYIVDLRPLSPEKREEAYNLINSFSFMCNKIFGENGLEGADVIWDLQEDFTQSSALPKGCPCRQL